MNTTQSRLNYEISQLLLTCVKIKKRTDIDVKNFCDSCSKQQDLIFQPQVLVVRSTFVLVS